MPHECARTPERPGSASPTSCGVFEVGQGRSCRLGDRPWKRAGRFRQRMCSSRTNWAIASARAGVAVVSQLAPAEIRPCRAGRCGTHLQRRGRSPRRSNRAVVASFERGRQQRTDGGEQVKNVAALALPLRGPCVRRRAATRARLRSAPRSAAAATIASDMALDLDHVRIGTHDRIAATERLRCVAQAAAIGRSMLRDTNPREQARQRSQIKRCRRRMRTWKPKNAPFPSLRSARPTQGSIPPGLDARHRGGVRGPPFHCSRWARTACWRSPQCRQQSSEGFAREACPDSGACSREPGGPRRGVLRVGRPTRIQSSRNVLTTHDIENRLGLDDRSEHVSQTCLSRITGTRTAHAEPAARPSSKRAHDGWPAKRNDIRQTRRVGDAGERSFSNGSAALNTTLA